MPTPIAWRKPPGHWEGCKREPERRKAGHGSCRERCSRRYSCCNGELPPSAAAATAPGGTRQRDRRRTGTTTEAAAAPPRPRLLRARVGPGS
eukprot:12024992-Alexandrium_andersonii.AAC.1